MGKVDPPMKAPTGLRRLGEAACFQPHSRVDLRPRGAGRRSWTRKSGSSRFAPIGVRAFGEAACFQPHSRVVLRPRGAGRRSWTRKSGSSRFAPIGVRGFGEAACFQPHSQGSLRPEDQAGGAGQGKAEAAVLLR